MKKIPPDKFLGVGWKLLNTSTPGYPDCPAPNREDNCVLSKKRVLAMAARILQRLRPAYHINLMGGEPTLHPFLNEIIHYFFASGRKVWLTLETNAAADLAVYGELLQMAPEGFLRFSLGAYPGISDNARFFTLIGKISGHGQPVHIRFFNLPEQPALSWQFLASLLKLREDVPFSLEMACLPEAGPKHKKSARELASEIGASFKAAAAKKPGIHFPFEAASLADNAEAVAELPASQDMAQRGKYCIAGINYLRIEPDGAFFDSPCLKTPAPYPLWHENAGSDNVRILNLEDCPRGQAGICAFRFEDADEAQTWLKKWQERTFDLMSAANLATEPDGPGNPLHLLLRQFARLDVDGKKGGTGKKANPAFIKAHAAEIVTAWQGLADAGSRKTLLLAIKAETSGNAACLPESDFPAGCVLTGLEPPEIIAAAAIGGGAARPAEDMAGLWKIKNRLLRGLPALAQIGTDAGLAARLLACLAGDLPGSRLFLARKKAGLQLLALPEKSRVAPVHAAPGPGLLELSIIVSARHLPWAKVRPLLYGLALQAAMPAEILLVAPGGAPANAELASLAAFIAPAKCRIIFAPPENSLADDYNIAMQSAAGDYLAFIEADAIPLPGFPQTAVNRALAENADILAAQGAGGRHDFAAKTAVAKGEDSLALFLRGAIAANSVSGILYKRSLLAKANAHFAGQGFSSVIFNAAACFYSGKTLLAPDCSWLRRDRDEPAAMPLSFDDYLEVVDKLHSFFRDHKLDAEKLGLDAFLSRLYAAFRKKIFEQNCQSFCQRPVAAAARRFAGMLLLEDYAALMAKTSATPATVRPEDADWQAEAAKPWPKARWRAYGAADNPGAALPRISVIMPNFNKRPNLEKTLASVFQQDMTEFELIAIDDASSDGSREMLEEYANLHANLRLYLMEQNVRQGICRNLGIEKARGAYLIFLDSDDLCLPGFFAEALRAITATGADLVLFSSRMVTYAGKTEWTEQLEDRLINSNEAIRSFFQAKIQPAPWAKIFRADVVKNANLKFSDYVLHQDAPFFLAMLRHSKIIATSGFVAVENVISQDSAMRPLYAKYLHVCSAFRFYNFIFSSALEIYGESRVQKNAQDFAAHILWNLEHVLLTKITAFRNATGAMPLTSAELAELGQNWLLLYALAAGFARCFQQSGFAEGNLALSEPTAQLETSACQQPLVSVIVHARDCENSIWECLDSLASQLLTAVEFIIIDDASADATADLCDAFAQKDKRFTIVHNSYRKGACACRNIGLGLASGPYLAFMEGNQLAQADFLVTGAALLATQGRADIVQFDIDLAHGSYELLPGAEALASWACGKSGYARLEAKIFRKTLLGHNTFPEHPYGENVLLLQMLASCKTLVCLKQAAFARVISPAAGHALPARARITGFIEACAKISELSASWPDAQGCAKRIASLFGGIRKDFLAYLASFRARPTSPLPFKTLGQLAATPELLKLILADYALWHGKQEQAWPGCAPQAEASLPSFLIPYTARIESDPTVSVILAVRNEAAELEPYLRQFGQEKHEDMELVLVDDCSDADNTWQICLEAAAQCPKVRLFRSNRFLGAAKCVNLALNEASGKYVLFSDCNLPPNWASLRQLANLPGQPDLLAFGLAAPMAVSAHAPGLGQESVSARQALEDMAATGVGFWQLGRRLFRLEFLKDAGLFFRPGPGSVPAFLVAALAKAKHERIVPSFIGPSGAEKPPAAASACDFANLIGNLALFFQTVAEIFGDDNDFAARKQLARSLWLQSRDFFLERFARLDSNNLPIPMELISQLAAENAFLEMLLEDYARTAGE